MKDVIIINGSGGVGKTTFINYCIDFWGENRSINISSIDIIKKLATQCGWTGEKTEKDRKFLSDLKKLTTDYNNYSFIYTSAMITSFQKLLTNYDFEEKSGLIFVDCREPEEIENFKKEFDGVTVLITRDSIPIITSNSSDGRVLDYKYDYYIKNDNDLKDLQERAELFVETIKGTN